MTLFNPETRYTQDVSFVNQQAQEELSQTIQWYDKVYEMEQDFQQKAFKQTTNGQLHLAIYRTLKEMVLR